MNDMLYRVIIAFLVGGGVCAIAQILIDKTKLTPARILVSFVVTGVILTGIGIYQPFVDSSISCRKESSGDNRKL